MQLLTGTVCTVIGFCGFSFLVEYLTQCEAENRRFEYLQHLKNTDLEQYQRLSQLNYIRKPWECESWHSKPKPVVSTETLKIYFDLFFIQSMGSF
jgi:hypothetical protein